MLYTWACYKQMQSGRQSQLKIRYSKGEGGDINEMNMDKTEEVKWRIYTHTLKYCYLYIPVVKVIKLQKNIHTHKMDNFN